MLKKTIIATFALLIAVFAFQPVEKAEAKVRIHIGNGHYYGGHGYGYRPRYGGYGYGYRPYYGGYYPRYYGGYRPRYRYVPRYRTQRTYRRGRVSCAQAKRIVRRNGYRRVRATDCRGKNYHLRGKKRGRWYSIAMRSRGGRIYSVRRR